MKFTTLNFKKDEYNGNHELFVGTHIGSFKRLNVTDENPYKQENLQDLKELKKDSKITALNFNYDKTEILIGHTNKFVQIYDLSTKSFTKNLEFSSSPIVGLCYYKENIVAGLENGNVEVIPLNLSSSSVILNAGDHISKMRECKFDSKFVATGGKERQNNLKIFDLEVQKRIFTSKNLPNDHLQLEVPIWDSDLYFLSSTTLTTCSRYGYIRLYDIRAQRKPIKNFANEQFGFSCIIGHENDIYVGTIKGELKSFDTRFMKTFKHTFKGCTGSVSDLTLDDNGKFLISGNLDRYVRVHNTDNCVLLYQCYVKTKATKVLVRNIQSEEYENEEDDKIDTTLENKDSNESDEEYEKMFDNMETITDHKNDSKTNVKRKNKEVQKVDSKKKKA